MHWAGIAFSILHEGAQDPAERVQFWIYFYYGHFLLLVMGTGAYLFFRYWRAKAFYPAPFVDFLAGVGAFVLVFSLCGLTLAHGWLGPAGPAAALAPGLFLLAYGWGLRRGRPFGFGPI